MELPANRPVLFFDGECNLCNGAVQFIIKRDSKKQFLFAPLQSPMGHKAMQDAALAGPKGGVKLSTIILWSKGKYYTRSAAALRTARLLNGLWPLCFVLIIVPPFIRDAVYDLIARNRYRWFGKRNECMIPTPELKERFISG